MWRYVYLENVLQTRSQIVKIEYITTYHNKNPIFWLLKQTEGGGGAKHGSAEAKTVLNHLRSVAMVALGLLKN